MSERRRWTGLRAVLGAAAALALSGCAATHVGEDWQCPLAQGEVCTSVAAADPAVPAAHGADGLAGRTPLYRGDGAGDATGAAVAEARTESGRACEADCDPLAWLASLFAGIGGDGGSTAGDSEETSAAGVTETEAPGMAATGSGSPARAEGPAPATPPAPEPSTAPDAPGETASPAPPAEAAATGEATPPLPAASVAEHDDPAGADLRAPEVIGRVWIGPFVDAGGIYREAHWVRVVMAPAAWRLP